jgi:hypothetical protein
MAELLGDLITETSGAQRRDRQAAGGDHQRLALDLTEGGVEQITAFDLLDGLNRRVHMQLDAGLIALGQEHFEDGAGFVIAKQLAEFFLVVGHGMVCRPCR